MEPINNLVKDDCDRNRILLCLEWQRQDPIGFPLAHSSRFRHDFGQYPYISARVHTAGAAEEMLLRVQLATSGGTLRPVDCE